MPAHDDPYQIKKEVQEQLAYIRVHLIGSEAIVSDEDGEQGKLSQHELAKRLRLSQPEIARLLAGQCAPRPNTRARIAELYFQARCRHWGAQTFFPICALAERGNHHVYRPDLPSTMLKLLHGTLHEEPLAITTQLPGATALRLDLHIRAKKLPDGVEAYSFGNDAEKPNVFVVLVDTHFGYVDQCRKAWEEVLAHVARIPGAKSNVVPISQPVMRHFQPGNIQ